MKSQALVVIDMQNDFVHEIGAFAQNGGRVEQYQAIVPTILTLIEAAKKAEIPIIFVGMAHDEINDGNGAWVQRRKATGHANTCRKGTWGTRLYGKLVEKEPDRWIWKHRYSAFVGTHFHEVLQEMEIDTLIFTGINTNTCVESTLRDAHLLDYHVALVWDATQCAFPDAFEATLKNVERHFGVVTESDKVIQSWRENTKHEVKSDVL